MKRAAGWAPLSASWALATWTLWWSVDRGRVLQRKQPAVFLGAAPLVGRDEHDGWHWRFGWGLVAAGAVGVLVVAACWLGWWQRGRLLWVAVAAGGGAMAFATALALTDGADGLLRGARHPTEYLANLGSTPPAGQFVRTFVGRIGSYSVHVRGHPPGFVLVLKFLHTVGLRGVWPVALLSVAATGVLAGAVVVAVHAVAGDEWARRSAPLLVVAPYAIWMVTSADAVYTAVGALGIAAFAVAVARRGLWAAALGLAGGLLLGALMFLTYVGAVLLVVPAVLATTALLRRRGGAPWAVLGACVGGVAMAVAFRLAGFWWLDGARATKREYLTGTAQFRTWDYFAVGNLGAALFAVGPATVAGLATLQSRRMWLLVAPALAGLLIAHLSQYTKGEVERIWLLFYPWLAVAAAEMLRAATRRRGAALVAGQATCAIVLQAALVSKW